jgi:hypothetical protein
MDQINYALFFSRFGNVGLSGKKISDSRLLKRIV